MKINNVVPKNGTIKIKPTKVVRLSQSGSVRSTRRQSSAKKNKKISIKTKQKVNETARFWSPFMVKLLNSKVKKDLRERNSVHKYSTKSAKNKGRVNSKDAQTSSPKKINLSKNESRNLVRIYCSSQITSPVENKNKRHSWRSTPKKIGRRNNASKMSHSHRSTFITKKSMKSGKSWSKNNDHKMSPQQTLLDFLLNSTSNVMSFAKDFDQGHARSQFTYQPTRSQVTTNAGTVKGTISPQSTNYIGTTRIMNSNQQFASDFKSTWEKACKALARKKK